MKKKKYEYFYFTHIEPCWNEMLGDGMNKEDWSWTNGGIALLENGMMFIEQDDLKKNERRIAIHGIRESLVGQSEEVLEDYICDIFHNELMHHWGIYQEDNIGAVFLTQEDFDSMMKDRKWVRTVSDKVLEGVSVCI